ncbi:DUF2254 family protein [uncultured Methanolobus sp.]|uniref:DUF2254 family protein n=1 Tax=uncultured Methanolobus sp. TaxID=218300 RepID=UPI0029C8CF2E|nr:DUF2254 family protein [uncultured Methanolobus sp.]
MLPNKLKEKYNELADFFDRPAWKNRVLFYLAIFVSIAAAFLIVFEIFKLIFSDLSILNNTAYTQYNATDLSNMGFFDNERYLLSALVQSLAATIALVITLSLVAVQLAAQSYSARIIDVYKRNPDMWILLCIYIITIFYGLGLTKIIGLGILGNYIEGAIFVAYFMGFFAFVCLVPYMLKTLDLLKPSTVITLLAEEITKEKILEFLDNGDDVDEKDPIQPIIDIINNSLDRNDYETVRNGLKAIKNSTILIFENAHFLIGEEDKVASRVLQHVERFGTQAAKKENEDSTLATIQILEKIGIKATEQKLEEVSIKTSLTLGKMGVEAVKQKLDKVASETVKALGNIGNEITNVELKNASWASVSNIEKVGVKAAEQGFREVIWNTSKELERVGIKTAEKEYKSATEKAIDALEKTGIISIEQELEKEATRIAGSLHIIGLKSTKKQLDNTAIKSVEALVNLGTKAAEEIFENTLWMTTLAIGKIGVKAATQV